MDFSTKGPLVPHKRSALSTFWSLIFVYQTQQKEVPKPLSILSILS